MPLLEPRHGYAAAFCMALLRQPRFAPAQRAPLDRNLQLAEDLGAELLVIADGSGSRDDIADALAEVVRNERVSTLVLGVARVTKRGFLRRSNAIESDLAQALIDRIESLEVHLVGYDDRNLTDASPS